MASLAAEQDASATPIESLSKAEERWVALYDFLAESGYRLRSRYKPGWKPSWVQNHRDAKDAEDALRPDTANVNHAINLDTGTYVTLKLVDVSTHSRELEIMELLASEQRAKDPRNHCVRSLEILAHPNESTVRIVVLPLLRRFDDPPFETIGEVVDFVGQILEGIEFIHDNGIAHRNISIHNFMLDGTSIYPDGFHPIDQSQNLTCTGPAERRFTRAEKTSIYLLTGFENAVLVKDGLDEAKAPLTASLFAADVLRLGSSLIKDLFEGNPETGRSGYRGLEFLSPLVEAMTHQDVNERPTVHAALERFHSLVQNITETGRLGAKVGEVEGLAC